MSNENWILGSKDGQYFLGYDTFGKPKFGTDIGLANRMNHAVAIKEAGKLMDKHCAILPWSLINIKKA